jgi:RNA polymerase sigma-70 factor (ECF subfamily)
VTPGRPPGAPDPAPADADRHPTPDDRELLAAHVAGDPDAFGELVRRHRDRLWAVALRTTGDREEAADAVQDGLISAFRRAETFRGDAQVTTWLHRIVVNACLDRMRRRRSRQTEALPEEEDRAAELAMEPGDDPAEVGERRTDVMAALASLPDEQRAALVLVDMEGYSVDDAAAILGCAPGTVKSRCSRGRARLVPLLTQYRRGVERDTDHGGRGDEPDRSRNRHDAGAVQAGVPPGGSTRDRTAETPIDTPITHGRDPSP